MILAVSNKNNNDLMNYHVASEKKRKSFSEPLYTTHFYKRNKLEAKKV